MATTPREGEYMSNLLRFLERNSKRYSEPQLRVILQRQGYTRSAIDRALRLFEQKKAKQEAKTAKKEEPKIEVLEEEPKKKGFFAWLFGK